jgi:predicted O-methyltransferase YrrM
VIPRVSYLDLVPENIAIAVEHRDAPVDGNVSPFEIDVISRLVKFQRPQTIFEIGTFDGRTTLNMARHCADNARVHTLDLPAAQIDATGLHIDQADRQFIAKRRSGALFIGTDVEHKITQLYGDSATYDFSPFFGMVDFVFVDGSHSYEYVLQDSQTAVKLVRPGGVILWHDYVAAGPTPWPGLARAIDQLFREDARFRDMKQIAGTAIVILRSPDGTPDLPRAVPDQSSQPRTSAQPEHLLASLEVRIRRRRIFRYAPIRVNIRATNTGRATWLASAAPRGPVRLGSRLLAEDGTWLTEDYSRHHVLERAVAPGESATFEARIPSPPEGRYLLHLDLVAEGVAWFSRNGPTAVEIPIQVVSETAIRRFMRRVQEAWHAWRGTQPM